MDNKDFCKIIINLLVISNRGGEVERKKNKAGFYDTDIFGNFIEKGIHKPNKLYNDLMACYNREDYKTILEWWKQDCKSGYSLKQLDKIQLKVELA